VHYKIGAVLWLFRILILLYVVRDIVMTESSYMLVTPPSILMGGFAYAGTMQSGTGQTWTMPNGTEGAYNASLPHYCEEGNPYSADFTWADGSGYIEHYNDTKCVSLEPDENIQVRLPTSFFYPTFYRQFDYQTVPMAGAADPLCNAASTNMKEIFGNYRCTTQSNYFPINPEGILQYFQFNFFMQTATGDISGGSINSGSMLNGDTKRVGVTTKIKDKDGTIVATFQPGEYISLTVEKLLRYADVDLDALAPEKAQVDMVYGLPYNRMTGATIQVRASVRDIKSLTSSPNASKPLT